MKKLEIDALGTLKVVFENELVFEATSDSTKGIEFWRFINNSTKEHAVVFD